VNTRSAESMGRRIGSVNRPNPLYVCERVGFGKRTDASNLSATLGC
jgi:hypothetical protein